MKCYLVLKCLLISFNVAALEICAITSTLFIVGAIMTKLLFITLQSILDFTWEIFIIIKNSFSTKVSI
jgi:hypothetical protein